jgi:acetylornithine deacetylase
LSAGLAEATAILEALRLEDPAFDADATLLLAREPYEIDPADPFPEAVTAAAAAVGHRAATVGMTFWTDAAILGAAGIPTVLFGPGGAGLHSSEEYVLVDHVCGCRDALVELARRWT